MSQQFHLPRILGFLAAIICTGVTLAFAAQVTPAKHDAAPDAAGRIVLEAGSDDSPGQGQMPPVVFDHSLHTRGDTNGEICAACHEPSSPASADAATVQDFRSVAGKTGTEREDAWHTGCISCHSETQNKGMRSGPLQPECRACHNAALPSAAPPPDGGMDASLHARHIASPLLTASPGEEQCAICHHPVKKPVSPNLEADSCRSCHPAATREGGADAPARPLFADVAHKKCISCHQQLAAKEPVTVSAPLTCAACHDPETGAGYAKLSPPPRLEAGQSDVVIMKKPLPAGDTVLPPPDAGASMLPVIFDHKRHEAVTENCVSCHHNTLQQCSACHTPRGAPKGGNVTWEAAMHMPASSRSCVGCHETRKATTPQCAGCHANMPARTQPDCASCHQPLDGGTMSPTDSRMMIPDAMAEYAAAQKMLDERGKTPAPDFSNVPENLSLGLLSDKFEPASFPHRAIMEKLAAGIRDTAPGMAWFHASPEALCGSCHHNTPPGRASGEVSGQTPPRCVACHAASAATQGSVPPDRPPLAIAYHQQCMSCHTRMEVTPTATNCAGCHTPRQKQAAGGGR